MQTKSLRKMTVIWSTTITLTTAFMLAGTARAALFLGWDTRVSAPETVASSYNAPGIQSSVLSIADSSVTATSSVYKDRWTLRDWGSSSNLAGAISNNNYLSFTIAPEAGQTIALVDSISLHYRRLHPSLSPTSFALLSSVDGFQDTEVLGSFTDTTTDQQTLHPAFGNLNIRDITGPVEFRIYGYDTAGVAQGIHIGPHEANPFGEPDTQGMTVAVFGTIPEPSSLSLLGLSLVGLFLRRRQRRA